FYERNVVMYLKNIVRKLKPCLFIDIGAYVGYYAILMAKWGCSVVALEPDPRSFALLMNNLFMSGLPEKVIALNEAVCDRENSQIPFKFSKSPSESSSTGYLRGDLVEFMGHVPCTKLDAIAQFLELRDKNMIIKIDVEGAALSVLRGSDSTIKRFKPYIVLEVHRTFDENDEMLAISMLRKYGYKWRLLEWRSQRNFIVALEPL
ncbi:FkbM family methyltransferase, partial [Candidatus Bathyarchaeota archaeon]|nr:FkbM family methyltransferase [Candidatus Bathyarchaeota archaeon]